MPPVQRGRVPGSVGRFGDPPRPGFLHGIRSNGPAGRIGGGRPLFAEAGRPLDEDTATDATAPPAALPEPEHALFDTVRLGVCTLPVFARGGPQPADVIQGRLNNCPIGAALMALAHTTPSTITAMISPIEGGGGSGETEEAGAEQGLQLYQVSIPAHAPVQITNRLYFQGESLTNSNIAYTHSSNGTMWMSLIEKAYATTLSRGYITLSQTGSGAGGAPDTRDVFLAIVGPCETAILGDAGNQLYSSAGEVTMMSGGQLRTMLRQARRRATIAATQPGIRGPVEAAHSYTVLGFAGGQVRLRDPRGGEHAVVSLSQEQFQQYFAAIIQATGR